MSATSDLKVGANIQLGEEPYVILTAQHVHMGRGGAIIRVKIRNLISGNVLERTFRGDEKVKEAPVERGSANYLYRDERNAYFMDNVTYENFSFPISQLGDRIDYLQDGRKVDVLSYKGDPVNIELPKKIELKVIQCPPGVRGDTAQGGATKQVTLETGLVVSAPLFIKEGDVLKINTETREYVERA